MLERVGVVNEQVRPLLSQLNIIASDVDSETLARVYNALWRRPEGGNRGLIGFSVASRAAVDEKYTELTAVGYRGVQPPYDAFWGARYAIVADPDGNDVGLMSPIDEHMRSFPPVNSPDVTDDS
jgi:uncharacterized glyoxalase superfamily protein PhnB